MAVTRLCLTYMPHMERFPVPACLLQPSCSGKGDLIALAALVFTHWRGRCFREIESVSYVTGVLRRTRHNGFPVVHGDGADPERDEGEFDELGCGASRTGPLEGVILRSQLLVLLGSQARPWPAPALQVRTGGQPVSSRCLLMECKVGSASESHGCRRAGTPNPRSQALCWARSCATRRARRCCQGAGSLDLS